MQASASSSMRASMRDMVVVALALLVQWHAPSVAAFGQERRPPPKPPVRTLPHTTSNTTEINLPTFGMATTVPADARTGEQAGITTTSHGARHASTPSGRASAVLDDATGAPNSGNTEINLPTSGMTSTVPTDVRTGGQAGTTTTSHGARHPDKPSGRASAAPDDANGPSTQVQYTVLVCTVGIVLCVCAVMGTLVKNKLSHGRASMSGHPAHSSSFKSRHAAPAKFGNLAFDASNVIQGSEVLEFGVLDDLLLPEFATQHQAGDAQIHAHGGFEHVSGGHTRSAYGMGATYAPEGLSFADSAEGLGAQGAQHTACMPQLPDLGESLGLPTLEELSPSPYEPWSNGTMSHSTGAYHDPTCVKLKPGMQMQMNMVQIQTKGGSALLAACSPGAGRDLGAAGDDGVLQTARPLSPPPVCAATLESRNVKAQYADVVDLNIIFLDGTEPPLSPAELN